MRDKDKGVRPSVRPSVRPRPSVVSLFSPRSLVGTRQVCGIHSRAAAQVAIQGSSYSHNSSCTTAQVSQWMRKM